MKRLLGLLVIFLTGFLFVSTVQSATMTYEDFGDVYFAKGNAGEHTYIFTFWLDLSQDFASIDSASLVINLSDDHEFGDDSGDNDDMEYVSIKLDQKMVVNRDELDLLESYGPFDVLDYLGDNKLRVKIQWKNAISGDLNGSQKDFLGDFHYGSATLTVKGDLIPIPETLWLFSSFLVCLVGIRSRFNKFRK